MNSLPSQSVTQWLHKWQSGDAHALDELTELVYRDLHHLARNYLRGERSDHTLQATALVHEAYLQLHGLQHIKWKNRAQFIAVIATVMRHVLVDHARRHTAQKRGGEGIIKLPLSRAERLPMGSDIDLIELNDALEKLAAQSDKWRRKAKVVELFYFGGLSVAEIAEVISAVGAEVKAATVEKDLKSARAWLYQALSKKER
jgi:RNA polymerase sigma factor (TIGR02999 family)